MTIGVAWISGHTGSQQLWVATDSRLSDDEYIWDDCPKIMPLPRRDTIAAFSGDTAQAYPLMLQCSNSISSYSAAHDGTLEFLGVVAHLQRVMNSMMGHVYPDPRLSVVASERPFSSYGDTIVLGGFSRRRNGLVIRALHYQSDEKQWRFEQVRSRMGAGRQRIMKIFGDSRARNRFSYLLSKHLRENGTHGLDVPLSLEPLNVLASFLRLPEGRTDHTWPMNERPSTIGGAPQVVHLYPGAQATPLAVHWEACKDPGVFVMGRRAFDYERLNIPLVTFSENGVHIHAKDNWPSKIRQRAMQSAQVQHGVTGEFEHGIGT